MTHIHHATGPPAFVASRFPGNYPFGRSVVRSLPATSSPSSVTPPSPSGLSFNNSHHLHGLARLARRSPVLKDNWDDRIPTLMRDAGFADAAETGHLTKHIGRLTYYRARRPQ